jgi:Ca2+-binding RTX toxin-like protein
MDGGAGDDTMHGGCGRRDTLIGGSGHNVLHGGRRTDYIDARTGSGRDKITCGGGGDVVMAHRTDRIAKDCQKVIYRG